MSGGRWALFALGALTVLFAAPSFGAGPTASAVLQREIDETQGMAEEALQAVSRVEIENAELRASLSAEGRNLTASDITAPMLQLGSLDVGAARSRLATLDNSIEHHESTLRLFDQEIERDGTSLGGMPADTLEQLAAKAERQKLAEARAATVELIENLGLLRVAEAQRLALTEERLALLQSRVELAAIHDNRGFERDPRAVAMRQVVSRLTRDSTALANQATAIEPASPEGSTRKRLLELQADDAIARATLRLGDLNLLRAQSQIDFLDELSSDLSIPVRVLSDGRLELDQLQTRLDARLEALDDERLNLEGRRALVQGQSLEASEVVASQLASVQALEDLVDFQRSDLAQLQERSAATVELLDTELAQRELRALGKRNALPSDAGHWALLSDELAVLPATTLHYWRGLAGAVMAQLGNASWALWALLAAAIAILSAALWWLHRTGLRWLVAQSPDNLLSIPIEALRRWLPAFLPAIIWLMVAWGCGVDPRPTWLLGGALALWPLVGSILGTDRLLAAATAGPASRAGGWGRAALIAAAAIGVVVLVVQAVPVLPSLADLVDRAGFVGLALAGIGTWALRKTLLEALRETSAVSIAAHRILEVATLAVPALLVLAAVMGIAGWISLGWTIAAALGAVLAATALVLILAAAFNDIARMMKARVGRQRRGDRAAIDAVCRLAVVGLTVGAAWLLFSLYAQNAMATTLFWVAVIACTLPFVLQPIETLVAAFFGIDPERRPDGSVSILAICVDRGVRMLLIIGAVLGVAWIMNFDIAALASGDSLETRLVRGAFNVALVALVADFVWHLAKTMIDQRLAEEGVTEAPAEIGGGEGGGQGASRLQTLLPLFRKFLMITLAVMVIMLVLSSLGVDIGPLLAGAGVIGLAIGFGAQTLVRDIVSGVFFLMDDAFRLGEYVDVGEVKGTVEHISIRSLRLRHHRGALHTIPFGEISHLSNYSRDWVIMKLQFRVPYDTDVQKVKKIFKKIGAEMLADPIMGPNLLDPPKSQGVLEMDDSAMIMRAKFMAKPGEQFVIRRELYHRAQKEFEAAGIEFARRQVSVFVPPGGDAATAAAAAAAIEEETATDKKGA